MFKAVLFDLDGTVINTNELILKSFRYTLKEHLGKVPLDSELIRYFGEPLMATMYRYDEKNAEEMYRTYKKFNRSLHDEMVTGYEGMEEALMKLKDSGIKVGIVTSKKRKIAERGLEQFNLGEIMDVIVTVEDTERKKPHGDPVLKALEILGVAPDEAIYVGDTNYDVLCGKNAGCRTCVVRYSMVPIEELMKYSPDYIIDKPLDIVGIAAADEEKAV